MTARFSTTRLHANWNHGDLFVWGETVSGNVINTMATAPQLLNTDELRGIMGDLWDSLLIAEARDAAIKLHLPISTVSSAELPSDLGAPYSASALPAPDTATLTLTEFEIPALSFEPADAYDLLRQVSYFASQSVDMAPSMRYWSRVGELVRELLARQRFVPAIHRGPADRYRGYWRVVVDEQETSDRLADLIAAMPPVCRAFADEPQPVQAATLVEDFLWTSVDALVRRGLENDELAHALQERRGDTSAPQTDWLRSLVSGEPQLTLPPEYCRRVETLVRGWLSALEPHTAQAAAQVIFKIEAAEQDGPERPPEWRLSLHVQSEHDPDLVVSARDLWHAAPATPQILPRPFDNAREKLRADVARAARHFPPLLPCAQADGPTECTLNLEETYRFLREAAPLLEADGFGVWTPPWWRGERPRLRMMLDVRPIESAAAAAPTMRLDSLVEYDWRIALGDTEVTSEEMTQLAEASAPLVRIRGSWVENPASELQAALNFLERGPSGRMTLLEALRISYLADDLGTGLPVAGLRAHGWIERLLASGDDRARVEPLPQPATFRGTLRPYQHRGMEWLSFLSRHGLGACLADDMGLGKTIQLISLLLQEREAGLTTGPTMLVVPMSLVGNWQRELARFAPELKVLVHHGLERLTGEQFAAEVARHDVVIVTYGLTHRDHEHLSRVDWHRIALDEAQNIKNPSAKQSVAIRSLRGTSRVALTGTPVENRLSELWSIVDFLNPGYLGTAADFRRRFAGPIERHHDAERAQRLRHLIRPFVLRRLKDDPNIAGDLPEKLEMTVFCNLTREQAGLYEALVNEMLSRIERAGGMQRRGLILAALVKLKQICNHPAHFLADQSPIPNRSGKCDRITDMLEEVLAEEHRALIFTQFREMGHLLQKHLAGHLRCEVLFLHGGTSQKARDEMVQRFQESRAETPILILSLKAGGLGLNLTAANHVFHFDRWWNPAVEDQATDRAHRIGQTRQVQVHKFVCIGTLEERIAALIEQKRSLARNVIGSGEEWITELSTDALRELFSLSLEAVAED